MTDRNYYTFDGIPLHDAQGRWTLGEGAEIRTVPAKRQTSHEIPGMDGIVVDENPPFDAGSLGFSIHILTNSSHDDAMKTLEFWNGVIGQRGRLIPLDHTYGGQTRRAMVQIAASSETENYAMQLITIRVVCTIPGSFWRDVTTTDATLSLNATNSVIPALSGGSGPINDSLIKFTGPFTSVTLTNPVGSHQIAINQSIATGNEVVLDTSRWKAVIRQAGTAWDTNSGLDISSQSLATRGFGDMFSLEPTFNAATLGKDYRITTRSTGTTSASKIVLRARRSFL